MSEGEIAPTGRWGCFALGPLLFAALLMVLVVALILVSNPGFQTTIQDFLNWQQDAADAARDGGEVPPISERYFSGGSTQGSVTGAFSVPDLPIDALTSYVDNEGLAWIHFGTGVAGEPEALITFNEPENAITVARDGFSATGQDDDCTFNVQVTGTLVSGHISCTNLPVVKDDGESAGTVSIELDFTAAS
jgi:hypothetical protein